jgi:hypothetical protein
MLTLNLFNKFMKWIGKTLLYIVLGIIVLVIYCALISIHIAFVFIPICVIFMVWFLQIFCDAINDY